MNQEELRAGKRDAELVQEFRHLPVALLLLVHAVMVAPQASNSQT